MAIDIVPQDTPKKSRAERFAGVNIEGQLAPDAPEVPPFEFPKGALASDLFKREKVPSDFVLPGFVAGTVGALIAPGSTGKSMLSMQLAAYVAGASVLGHGWTPEKTGEVVILAVEDPENELYNRWGDLGSVLRPEQREMCSAVHVIPLFGMGFDIMRDDCFNALVALCKGKRLVVMDTLRRIHTLDENDSSAMSLVVARLEQVARITGCAILFLHHTNKGSAMSGGGGEQQASRGSSVLVDNIRYQMFMVGMTADEANEWEVGEEMRSRYVRVGLSKVNYSGKPPLLWLRRDSNGILLPGEFSTSWITSKKRVKPSRRGNRDEA